MLNIVDFEDFIEDNSDILFLDFKKAVDIIEHLFIPMALQHYRSSPELIDNTPFL